MNDKSLKLIKEAILHEYEGADYYTYQSKQWHTKEVANNFLAIAKEELLHAKWLVEVLEAKTEPMDKKIFTFMNDVKAPGLFDWSSIEKNGSDDIKSVFKKAMDMEKESYIYYEKAKSIETDEDVILLYDLIINWEKSHYNTFEKLYQSMYN